MTISADPEERVSRSVEGGAPARPRGWYQPASLLRFPLFDAVHHSAFRYIWLGQTCTSMAMWMDQVTRSWLLYELTRSPLQLGLLQVTQAVPMLFLSPVAGTAADRFDRKLQIIAAQVLDAVMYAVLAVLIVSGQIEPWHVYLSAAVHSMVSTFHHPARAAMISDAVPPRDLTNAIALTSVSFNVSRSVGPAVAGVLIAVTGTASSYVAQGLLYLLATFITIPLPAALRFPSSAGGRHGHRGSFASNVVEGWAFSWRHETVRTALLLVTMASVFILPFAALLPVFARDILHVGAPGQGVLLTAMGVGAFCSSVVVAALGSRLPRGLLMLGGVILYGVTVVLFANSPSFPLSVALMVIAGLFHVSTHTMTQIVVQAYTPAELRGRTMALLQQTHVVQMGGGLLLGAMATLAGAPLAITVMAAAGTIIAAVIFVAVPGARRIR